MDTGIVSLAAHTALIVLQLLALHVLSRHLNKVLLSGFGTAVYLSVSLPGAVIHELSHYVGCLLTRTRIHEVRLFSPRKEGEQLILGYVSHARPRNPLASFVIGTAPFFGGASVLWLAARLLVPGAFEAVRPSLATGGMLSSVGGYMTFVAETGRMIWSMDWRSLVMLYLLISVPTHLAPSAADLKNAAWGIILIAASIAVFMAGASFLGWEGTGSAAGAFQAGITVLAGLLTFALLCCIVVTLTISAVFRLIRG